MLWDSWQGADGNGCYWKGNWIILKIYFKLTIGRIERDKKKTAKIVKEFTSMPLMV